MCPVWLIFLCPPRVLQFWAGWRAEPWVRIKEPPEIQTNLSHWPGSARALWPAADHWPARPSRPQRISMLDGPGWVRLCWERLTVSLMLTYCVVTCLEWLFDDCHSFSLPSRLTLFPEFFIESEMQLGCSLLHSLPWETHCGLESTFWLYHQVTTHMLIWCLWCTSTWSDYRFSSNLQSSLLMSHSLETACTSVWR